MSWDVCIDRTEACDCGAGTIRYVMEMDDWGRARDYRVFDCKRCEDAHAKVLRQREEAKAKRDQLLEAARRLASERYLERWLRRFEACTKKQIWQLLTEGRGCPALGTFYQHVKGRDVAEYLTRWFNDELVRALEQLGVRDIDVDHLLAEWEKIPEYREPHPYQ